MYVRLQKNAIFFALYRKHQDWRSDMIHTAYDVMKEFLITDADIDGKYGIPKIPKTFIHPGKDTVDFAESFSRKIKNHRELDVNFYVDDVQFQRLWNQPDKFI